MPLPKRAAGPAEGFSADQFAAVIRRALAQAADDAVKDGLLSVAEIHQRMGSRISIESGWDSDCQ